MSRNAKERNMKGPVARNMVGANHLFRSIETYTFLWSLTLVSANHASRNSSQICNLCLFKNSFRKI